MLYTEVLWDRLRNYTRGLMKSRGLSQEEAFGWGTDGEGCPWAEHYTEAGGRLLLSEAGFEPLECVEYNHGEFRTFHAVAP